MTRHEPTTRDTKNHRYRTPYPLEIRRRAENRTVVASTRIIPVTSPAKGGVPRTPKTTSSGGLGLVEGCPPGGTPVSSGWGGSLWPWRSCGSTWWTGRTTARADCSRGSTCSKDRTRSHSQWRPTSRRRFHPESGRGWTSELSPTQRGLR